MNPKIFTTLEFEHIRERLHGYALCYLGKRQIEQMAPSTDVRQIDGWLAETDEALRIALTSSSVPIPTLDGVEVVMKALNKGYTLNAEQISQFARFLLSAEQLRRYMERKTEIAPRVCGYAQSLVALDDLREEIERCVQHGEVLDGASDELSRIRKQIGILEDRVRRKIEAALQKYKSHLQESFYSQRGGRYVLPIKRESKRLVKGSILDESASGQTVYIEPEEVSNQQEELSEMRFAEDREISRILSVLTGLIERHQETIRRNLEVVGHYDFLFAKAKLAKSMDGRMVRINTNGQVRILGGRHPLLGNEAKPLDFHIGDGFRALIITGPNTGGKTVALKTVGLLTLMMQCGLLVPVEKDSELSIFHEVLADIGDGQSLDQSLSTFSAHVTNVIQILSQAGPKSLVLLDELATGTDPGEGIGLSIALLESLYRMGATIVATTHFNEIKQFAGDTPGFENARMEFDTQTLQPLYRLRIGEAGQSYALVIAEKLGVPSEIVERARALAVGAARHSADIDTKSPRQKTDAQPQRLKSGQTTTPVESNAEGQQGSGGEPTSDEKAQRGYLAGDRVWIHPLKKSGIYVEPADDKGNVIVLVQKQRMTFNVKRIAPYLSREELYPDIENYDLDIVLESKEARRKRKIMAKHHVEGMSIDLPTGGGDTHGRK